MTQLTTSHAPTRTPDVAHDQAGVAGVALAPDEAASGSRRRRSQVEELVAIADGRRESVEQRRAYFLKRLHRASNDFDATEGLRVVEAALRLIPRPAAAPQV